MLNFGQIVLIIIGPSINLIYFVPRVVGRQMVSKITFRARKVVIGCSTNDAT